MHATVAWDELTPHLTGIASLATATADGRPHASAVMPYVEGTTIWLFTTATSGKARRIAANGQVALMWRPEAEAYVYGDAVLVDDLAEKRRIWAKDDLPFAPAGFFGSPDNPDHVLVRVTPTRAVLMVGDATGIHRRAWHAT